MKSENDIALDRLYQWSARDTVAGLKSGQISAHDALDSVERRIAAVDPAINALPTLCFERARKEADRLQALPPDQRGLLCGLPVTIKDLTEVARVPTSFGSSVYDGYVSRQSDRLVLQIEGQGGVVYAKSNTPEFGTGGITFNNPFGITRSPRNTRFASGGSSGGAAASLASGCAWLSHGSDMAGSLRTPASFCGVSSLRPSPGRILADSAFMPFDILGAEGPMARDIQDLGLFADAMMVDSDGAMQRATAKPQLPSRIAYSANLGIATIDDAVLAVFDTLIEALAATGTTLVDAHPDLSGVDQAFDVLRAHSYAVSYQQTLEQHPGKMKPEVVWNIERGLALSSAQLREATRSQGSIINRAAMFMQDYDLLICPAVSQVAVDAALRYPGSDQGVPIAEYYRWLAIAYATTMTALPVITLPCGVAHNGMPVALQLIGKPRGEAQLFQIARALESLTNWSAQPVDPVQA